VYPIATSCRTDQELRGVPRGCGDDDENLALDAVLDTWRGVGKLEPDQEAVVGEVMRSQRVVVLVRSVGAEQPIMAETIAVEKRHSVAVVGAAIYDPAQASVAVRTLVAGGPLLDIDLMSPRAPCAAAKR
jgi:hypothetical protein